MNNTSRRAENGSARASNSCEDGAAPLTADQLILRSQGHKEEMPRQFSLMAAVGLAFSITNSWIAISAVFQQPMTAGGGPGVIYSVLVAAFACSTISKFSRNF